MAHIQDYYNALDQLYASQQQPRSQSQSLSYDISRPAASCPEVSMAQPLPQGRFRPEMCMSQSHWSISQSLPSDNMMFVQAQLHGQHAVSGNDMVLSELSNEPHIEGSMLLNQDLLYSHDASQITSNKATDFGNSAFWLSNIMVNIAPSPSADILLSPASPFSDLIYTYSPGSEYRPATPSQGTKISSPGFAPPTPQSVIQQHPGSAATQGGLGVSMTSAGRFPMSNASDDATIYGSEHSYEQSQNSSPGLIPWYPPGYIEKRAAIAQDPRSQQADKPRLDRRPNSYLAPLEGSSRHRQGQWSNQNAIPVQSHFQTRFMAPPTDSEKAQRSEDDKILLKMKGEGYTYKDIRKKLGVKVAESTLRGRYRSLTKPRSARVRAPKWQEVDIDLMRRYVQEEFDKLDHSQPSLDAKQKPNKIPWAKIAEKMVASGGSYKFGAATVKQKWRETSQSISTRSSLRRSRV